MSRLLKSVDGIPMPLPPPPDIDMAREARIARRRCYPVTILYSAYASVVLPLGFRAGPRSALVCAGVGIATWTLLEYLTHRFVLHGAFADGTNWLQHELHVLLDASHLEHHQRPWDGMHINGRLDTVPLALALAAPSLLAPLATVPVFVATVLACYVVEEWVHYAVHFHRFDNAYFRYIRRHHLYHHGRRGREEAFGLTSGLWDGALGTARGAADQAPKSLRRTEGCIHG
jgi:sterol desaturase/sphingolipid hydroxylase (fatty acid hydroxylase superfamily)